MAVQYKWICCVFTVVLFFFVNAPVSPKTRLSARNLHNSSGKFSYHRVKNGENLYRISRKHHVSIDYICKINRIKNKNSIKYGDLIKIPAKKKRISQKNKSRSPGLSFSWPVSNVKNFKKDMERGVKPIGIIIKGKKHSRVHASATGTVYRIGEMRGYGKYVVIKHPGRYITVYAKLSGIYVSEGQKIRKSKLIGRTQRNSLHFQIDHRGKPLNPLKLLPRRG